MRERDILVAVSDKQAALQLLIHTIFPPVTCLGSTIVYPYGNTSLRPLELGASIFVKANKNLWRATDEFNLTRLDFDEDGGMAIWDGKEFILSVSIRLALNEDAMSERMV